MPKYLIWGRNTATGGDQMVNVDSDGDLQVDVKSGVSLTVSGITIADGADATQGTQADAAWSGSGVGTVVAILKKLVSVLTGTLTISGTVDIVKGTKTFSRVVLSTAPSQIVAANANRRVVMLYNIGDSDAYLGKDSSVSILSFFFPAGSAIQDDSSTDAWWGITETGSADIRVIEVA